MTIIILLLLWVWGFSESTYKWDHIVSVFLLTYLPYFNSSDRSRRVKHLFSSFIESSLIRQTHTQVHSFHLLQLDYSTGINSFPGGSVVKNLPANAGDAGSIPGSGRSSGGGDGNPLQYSCLENPMDRGAWQAMVQGVTKSWTRLSTHAETLMGFSGGSDSEEYACKRH